MQHSRDGRERTEEGRAMLNKYETTSKKDRRALHRLDAEMVEWIIASANLRLWPAEEWPPYQPSKSRAGWWMRFNQYRSVNKQIILQGYSILLDEDPSTSTEGEFLLRSTSGSTWDAVSWSHSTANGAPCSFISWTWSRTTRATSCKNPWLHTGKAQKYKRATPSIRRRITSTQGNQEMEQGRRYNETPEHYSYEEIGTSTSPAPEDNTNSTSKEEAPTRIQLEYSEALTGDYTIVDWSDEKRITRDGFTTLCSTGETENAPPNGQEPQDWTSLSPLKTCTKKTDNKADEDKNSWTEQDQQAVLLGPPLAWEFISALSAICQGVIEMPRVMQLPEGMTQVLLGDQQSRSTRGTWRGETCNLTEDRTPRPF
eukprot:748630-Hanusia_phi.AAC.3